MGIKKFLREKRVRRQAKKKFLRGINVEALKIRREAYRRAVLKQARIEGKQLAKPQPSKLSRIMKGIAKFTEVNPTPTGKRKKRRDMFKPTQDYGFRF